MIRQYVKIKRERVRRTQSALANLREVHPGQIESIDICGSHLDDNNSHFLTDYLAVSTSLEFLTLKSNHIGKKTARQLANALCRNRSLCNLRMTMDLCPSTEFIYGLLVTALRININRHEESYWSVLEWEYHDDYSDDGVDHDDIFDEDVYDTVGFNETNIFPQLMDLAIHLGPPSMMMFLIYMRTPEIPKITRIELIESSDY